MSAFICTDYHINALVNWASLAGVTYYTGFERRSVRFREEAVTTLLAEANMAGVNERYDENNVSTHTYESFAPDITPVQVLKAVDCLDYQCCEWAHWEDSNARRVVEAIRDEAIRKLPGYDAAEWELIDDGRRAVSLTSMIGGR